MTGASVIGICGAQQITKDGDIVDEATLRLNNALKQQKRSTKDALANSILNKAVEAEVLW